MRSLLASDVYSSKGRLRADDMLVRERVGRGLGEATTRLREPIRKGERRCRAIEDAATAVRGLPVLTAGKVWGRVRGVGLEELMQFDWGLVGESDGLATDLAGAAELDAVDAAAVEGRLRRLRELMADRRRYLEIQA